jgi:glyoxylase-like metal-dependent hydrolase (beta-lactamase superfamily II)
MRVHHLNCGSFVNGMVSHVLLCETDDGLVLVDSGVGVREIVGARARAKVHFKLLGHAMRESEAALRQIEALGYQADDVKHIVFTHLDLDHAGGAADFPRAAAHTTAAELVAARQRRSLTERVRYRPMQLADLDFRTYAGAGAGLLGFPTAYPIDAAEDIVLIPLPGHTRGHAAVAVNTGRDGWLLHAGDAFYHYSVITGERADAGSRFASVLENRVFAMDRRLIAGNHRRLRALADASEPRVRVFCAHDRRQFEELAAQSPSGARRTGA